MSNPTYATSTAIRCASGLRSRVQIDTDEGPRDDRLLTSQDSVSPVSTMSSTTSTSRPVMSESRSFRIRTTPDDVVPEPYDETAIQSISTCRRRLRARSAITMTAPRSTPTSSRSRPS
jgi:hypothetical protein